MARTHCVAFAGAKRFSGLEKPIERVLFLAFSFLKERAAFCEVHCLTDAAMRSLNRSARGKSEHATVLSFPAAPSFPRPDVPKGVRYLGEIYLAPDTIARKGEWPLPRYLVHGALHLLGYTHSLQSDRIEMESREAEIAACLKKEGAL